MAREQLHERYQQYIENVSSPEMAISLELAEWLIGWCEAHKPKRILDLGSGFSSWVFHTLTDADVWSVDTDEGWLDKTAGFIGRSYPDNLFTWQKFTKAKAGLFDLVFVDIDHDGFRVRKLRQLASYCKPGGVIVFDDAQRDRYRATIEEHAKIQGWELEQPAEVKDSFGRYALLARVPEKPPEHDDKMRVIVAVARERFWLDEATWWLHALASKGWPMIKQSYARKDLQCENFAWHLLDNPLFTHVLMLDMDHNHPHDIVERLGRHALRDRSRWVIGGLNHRRCAPFEPCAYKKDEGGTYSNSYWTPELQTVAVLGGASVLIAREVFERIPPPWFGYDYSGADRRHYPGTDVGFSKRCEKHGIELWVDPTCCSPHYRLEEVDMAYYHKWLQEHSDEIDEDGTMRIQK